MTNLTNNQRLHYFDGLRAIACLLILFHHTVTANIVSVLEGWHLHILALWLFNFTQSGVEMFFLLSGILLLRPYLLGLKTFQVKSYYQRRFWRIYSPYFFAALFASFVIWLNTAYPTWYSSILVKFSTWGFVKQFFIFNLKGDYYNLAWWSLQIEVLFYIAVPVLLLFSKKWKFFPTVIVTVILSVLLQATAAHYFPSYYSTTQLTLGPLKAVDYPLCFVLGIFLAKETFSINRAWMALLAGVFLQVASIWYLPFTHMSWGLIYFGVLVCIGHYERLKNMLSSYPMVWIGERSYSLFLTHFSVLYLTNYLVSYLVADRSMMYGVLSRGLGLLFCFLTAMTLFYVVERRQARGLQTASHFWPQWKQE